MTGHVRIETEDGVMTVTLNRPDKKNALTQAMYAAVGGAIEAADDDSAVRCLLIRAEGDMFTAGNDVADFIAVGAARGADDEGGGEEAVFRNPLLVALAKAQTPIVAAVQGRAVGVGVTLLLHCDLVVVAEDAMLSVPFVNLALVPEAASSLLLPSRIGHARAFALFALGEAITGAVAAQWGIANLAVPAVEVGEKALAYAQALAARPPAAVAATKALMRDAERLAAVMDAEGRHFAAQLRSPEAREAFQAFAERRTPDFSKL